MKLPIEFKKYFWDVNFDELELEKYKKFISERILVYGNLSAVKWLKDIVGDEFLHNLIKTSRRLDKKTISFWRLYYDGVDLEYASEDSKRCFF